MALDPIDEIDDVLSDGDEALLDGITRASSPALSPSASASALFSLPSSAAERRGCVFPFSHEPWSFATASGEVIAFHARSCSSSPPSAEAPTAFALAAASAAGFMHES